MDENDLLSGTGVISTGLPPVLASRAKPRLDSVSTPQNGITLGGVTAMPSTGLPPVTSLNPSPEQKMVGAARNQLQHDQDKPSFTAGLWEKTKGSDSFLGKLGHIGAGILRGVDIGGEILAPNIARNIPGTGLNRSQNIQRDQAALASAEANAHTAAETAKDTAETQKAIYGDPLEAQKEAARADLETRREQERDRLAQQSQGASEKRLNEQIQAGEQRQQAANAEAEKRQGAQFAESEKRQNAQFAEQEKLQAMRDKAAEGRASRQDIRAHDKEYVLPAEGKEQTYKVFEGAYRDYLNAKIAGKHLPTGAQSMVALSAHIANTFGGVKGNRLNKDMIEKHLGARGVSDKALVAFQRFTNGDELSPDQWKAFFDLVKSGRDESWAIAKKEAERKNIPVDFLPEDLANAPKSK